MRCVGTKAKVLKEEQMIYKRLVQVFLFVVAQLAICNNAISQGDQYQPQIDRSFVQVLEQGRQLLKTGEIVESIEKLRAVIKERPNYYGAQYSLALAYIKHKDYDNAIECFTEALKIKDEEKIAEATIYNSIGWAYFMKGDYKKAEHYYLIGLRQESQSLLNDRSKEKLMNNIGLLYIYQGNLELAKTYLSMAKERYDSSLAQKNLELVSALEETNLETIASANYTNPITTLTGQSVALESEGLKGFDLWLWSVFWILIGGACIWWFISRPLIVKGGSTVRVR